MQRHADVEPAQAVQRPGHGHTVTLDDAELRDQALVRRGDAVLAGAGQHVERDQAVDCGEVRRVAGTLREKISGGNRDDGELRLGLQPLDAARMVEQRD